MPRNTGWAGRSAPADEGVERGVACGGAGGREKGRELGGSGVSLGAMGRSGATGSGVERIGPGRDVGNMGGGCEDKGGGGGNGVSSNDVCVA